MILMPAGRACFAAGKGAAAAPVMTFRGVFEAEYADGNLSTSIDIGTASADRVVVVALAIQNGIVSPTCTVAGVSLTSRVGHPDGHSWIFSGVVASGSGSQAVTAGSSGGFVDFGVAVYTITGLASAVPKATAAGLSSFASGMNIAAVAGDFLICAAIGGFGSVWTLGASTETLTRHQTSGASTFSVGSGDKTVAATNAAFHIGNDAYLAAATWSI